MMSCEKFTNIRIFLAFEGFLKKYSYVSRTITTAKMDAISDIS